ncbi:molybdopterin molybdotransferase MoeA [Aestuariibaculum suncheonense]|uniref:Molybdopterin molybdenumtransferase n=1 Tax=Aestuariibaculum suncheonense TaxID=1028745 RepID=A0A8J6Q739_9FLAO|nr:gephyrin-like molybdotransferase Glp [Aestuariibaculum suncheonense]MBD0835808.1 molybdopterin molybdotransferase MoeA [Aestuariibaculum suncheonense]
MITINEAIDIVKTKCLPLLIETTKPLEKSGGYKLSCNIYAPMNMPPFRQSAMDGYALNWHDKLTYTVIAEIKAGDNHQPILKKGEAVRIFTGAPVPDSANTVIMQEKVTRNENTIKLENPIAINMNIRDVGEQVKKSQLALAKGTKLTPAAIGYLSSLGIKEVNVYKKPSVAILTTGNELVEPGIHLEYGQIYESNSQMLLSALYSFKFYDVTIHKVKDDYHETLNTLDHVIKEHDLVIISGGISVGDYDFVGQALKALQVEEHFYKVNQKPGKPLFFGTKQDTYIFALPGNPAASLTCFYIYVFTALQRLMNSEFYKLPRIQVKSDSIFKKHGDRPQFLKATYNGNTVTILEGQSSSMLQTYAICNALVFMPEDQSKIKVDDLVEVILLPV